MAYRIALRRTQKQVDQERKARINALPDDYRELQNLARERGIPVRQSADALREALSND